MQYGDACEAMAGVALPETALEHISAVVARLRSEPQTLLKLLPFFIIACSLPAMLAPLFRGPPAVPEPRCVSGGMRAQPHASHVTFLRAFVYSPSPSGPLMPGDEGYGGQGDDDGADVGCVPPRATGSAAKRRKGGKKSG